MALSISSLITSSFTHHQQVAASANAALTPRQGLRLARQIVNGGWSESAAAGYLRFSYPTTATWARRHIELDGERMPNLSSRPRSPPKRTSQKIIQNIVPLRIKKRLVPVQIAGRLDMRASTCHAVLVLCHLNRLSHVDVRAGEPTRRYAKEAAGGEQVIVHTVIDDHSRFAYAESHDDDATVDRDQCTSPVERPVSNSASRTRDSPSSALDQQQDRTLPPHSR